METKTSDVGSDVVDLWDYPWYSETALLETLTLSYPVGNSKPLCGTYGLPEVVIFYISAQLINRTLQDFEELVSARTLQSNDLKQTGAKGVKKSQVFNFMCV